MEIRWTKHAEERQTQWEKKLGITRQEVKRIVIDPEQIVPGDLDALVAQSRRGMVCCGLRTLKPGTQGEF